MSNEHTILATVTFENDDVSFDLDLDITFDYEEGDPGTPPSLSYPGDPPSGPVVMFLSAELFSAEGVKLALGRDLTKAEIDKLAEDWLASEYGYERACEAVDLGYIDPDQERDRRAERWED